MKTLTAKFNEGAPGSNTLRKLREKASSNSLFMYALQLVLLYILVFAAFSTFAQGTSQKTQNPTRLEFARQTVVFNSGKVYLNWVSKSNSVDCIYVIERSTDGNEYEPVGLKEGIGSPMELLYSWVDTKPVNGTAYYRIKQINDEGSLVAQAEPRSVNTPESSPLFMDKSNRMVQAK
ncbi:MAG: hypothetical protein ACKO1U_08000 [Bacteroidota bacterium]